MQATRIPTETTWVKERRNISEILPLSSTYKHWIRHLWEIVLALGTYGFFLCMHYRLMVSFESQLEEASAQPFLYTRTWAAGPLFSSLEHDVLHVQWKIHHTKYTIHHTKYTKADEKEKARECITCVLTARALFLGEERHGWWPGKLM